MDTEGAATEVETRTVILWTSCPAQAREWPRVGLPDDPVAPSRLRDLPCGVPGTCAKCRWGTRALGEDSALATRPPAASWPMASLHLQYLQGVQLPAHLLARPSSVRDDPVGGLPWLLPKPPWLVIVTGHNRLRIDGAPSSGLRDRLGAGPTAPLSRLRVSR